MESFVEAVFYLCGRRRRHGGGSSPCTIVDCKRNHFVLSLYYVHVAGVAMLVDTA